MLLLRQPRISVRLLDGEITAGSVPARNGRPRNHSRELALSDPATWPDPPATTSTMTSRYGMAAAAGDGVHPRLTRRAAWLDHDGTCRSSKGP